MYIHKVTNSNSSLIHTHTHRNRINAPAIPSGSKKKKKALILACKEKATQNASGRVWHCHPFLKSDSVLTQDPELDSHLGSVSDLVFKALFFFCCVPLVLCLCSCKRCLGSGAPCDPPRPLPPTNSKVKGVRPHYLTLFLFCIIIIIIIIFVFVVVAV